MAPVAPVSAVHEDVHEHAQQEKSPNEPVVPGDVGPVLVTQQKGADAKKYQQRNAGPRTQKPAGPKDLVCHALHSTIGFPRNTPI
jgi:hypothetical protein